RRAREAQRRGESEGPLRGGAEAQARAEDRAPDPGEAAVAAAGELKRGVASLLALVAVSSCCPKRWPEKLAPLPDASGVQRAAVAAQPGLRTLSATAKVDAFTKQGRARVREVLVVDDRGRLRFETLSPFEQPL